MKIKILSDAIHGLPTGKDFALDGALIGNKSENH
jgi:hypothetical protein